MKIANFAHAPAFNIHISQFNSVTNPHVSIIRFVTSEMTDNCQNGSRASWIMKEKNDSPNHASTLDGSGQIGNDMHRNSTVILLVRKISITQALRNDCSDEKQCSHFIWYLTRNIFTFAVRILPNNASTRNPSGSKWHVPSKMEFKCCVRPSFVLLNCNQICIYMGKGREMLFFNHLISVINYTTRWTALSFSISSHNQTIIYDILYFFIKNYMVLRIYRGRF